MTRTDVLVLGAPGTGNHLRISLGRGSAPWHMDTVIAVEAHPFAGVLDGVLTDDDLKRFADDLADPTLPRTATLGGGRAPELVLTFQEQLGVGAGKLAMSAGLAWTGDDPYPALSWLHFDVPPDLLSSAAARIRSELAG